MACRHACYFVKTVKNECGLISNNHKLVIGGEEDDEQDDEQDEDEDNEKDQLREEENNKVGGPRASYKAPFEDEELQEDARQTMPTPSQMPGRQSDVRTCSNTRMSLKRSLDFGEGSSGQHKSSKLASPVSLTIGSCEQLLSQLERLQSRLHHSEMLPPPHLSQLRRATSYYPPKSSSFNPPIRLEESLNCTVKTPPKVPTVDRWLDLAE